MWTDRRKRVGWGVGNAVRPEETWQGRVRQSEVESGVLAMKAMFT